MFLAFLIESAPTTWSEVAVRAIEAIVIIIMFIFYQ